MSVLIKGMEMPLYCDTDCPGIQFRVCPIKELGEALMYRYEETRHPDCPIVEVPPHGRLIDADALAKDYDGFPVRIDPWVWNELSHAPTIIPAEPCNDLAKPNNNIFAVQNTDEDEGLFAAKPIDYMHTPSVEEIIKGDGE